LPLGVTVDVTPPPQLLITGIAKTLAILGIKDPREICLLITPLAISQRKTNTNIALFHDADCLRSPYFTTPIVFGRPRQEPLALGLANGIGNSAVTCPVDVVAGGEVSWTLWPVGATREVQI
jgi:hypothetical protein